MCRLAKELSKLGLDVPERVREQLVRYLTELEHWNGAMNLTSLEGASMIRRLVAEPVWIGAQLQLSGEILDVGSGNGSPALPLCITRAFKRAVMVEARAKRAAFLRHAIMKLGLQNVVVEEARVEDLAPGAGPVDWITLQAVRFTPALGAALTRLAKPTTQVVWISAGLGSLDFPAEKIAVPGSRTEAWVFRLDPFCPGAS
jgi:16S rRNA (guanine(527)-N(7))-methyltransferase RsmG